MDLIRYFVLISLLCVNEKFYSAKKREKKHGPLTKFQERLIFVANI